MAVAVVKNSVASGRFRVINSTLPTKTISTSKPALIKLYLTNNFLTVQAPGFIRGINRKHPKSLHPQAPGFIRGVNLKSQIE